MPDDYILKIARLAGNIAAKLIFKKEQSDIEKIDIEGMTEIDILPILLKRLSLQRKYNEAENILFEEMERNPSQNILEIGNEFYNNLLLKSDEELSKGKFTRKEIYDGMKELKEMV